jgi:hypothetical protein
MPLARRQTGTFGPQMSPSSGYFFRRDPCQCCDSGPLIYVKCSACGVLIGWCGESDYGVGRIEGAELFPFGRGEHRDWARKQCPACGAAPEALGYAGPVDLQTAGVSPRSLMRTMPDGSTVPVGSEW